jgi:prevent-host-death family protein
MREIQASEAKTHLPKLLDAVERGETIIITRHGRAVARLSPEARDDAKTARALENLRKLGKRTGKITADEVLAWRDEGRN